MLYIFCVYSVAHSLTESVIPAATDHDQMDSFVLTHVSDRAKFDICRISNKEIHTFGSYICHSYASCNCTE